MLLSFVSFAGKKTLKSGNAAGRKSGCFFGRVKNARSPQTPQTKIEHEFREPE